MNSVFLKVENLTKIFPGGVVALDNVTLEIKGGEFTAILGENGAGKSTLAKILYGIYTPDSGVIKIGGRVVEIGNPIKAIKKGIVMVSQIPQLIDRLTVVENVSLSLSKIGLLSNLRKVSRLIEEASGRIGVKIEPNAKVWSLTYTQKQIVEIIRAMLLDAKVLILDEALTYLPADERRRFYSYLSDLKKQGRAVVFVTHRIPEALEIADKIYVLRRGRLVGFLTRDEVSLEKVRELMFGEAAKYVTYERFTKSCQKPPGRCVIKVEDLEVLGDFGELVVKGVSLNVREGEIVGIAGVSGNGQRELLEALVNLRHVKSGRVFIDGVDVTNKGVRVVRELGVGFIPDQPLRYAVSSDNTILENIATLFSRNNFFVQWDLMRKIAGSLIEECSVWPPRTDVYVKLLSGGNIMKVAVCKEIAFSKKALIAYNPTRSLDEIAAIHVRRMIRGKADNDNTAVLFASEDLFEVLQLSDVVYVMNNGKLYGPLDPVKTPVDEIEKLMVN